MSGKNKDEDRKSVRRENFSKKKNFSEKQDVPEDFRISNKIKKEFKSKKIDINQEELWEDWQEQLDKYNHR